MGRLRKQSITSCTGRAGGQHRASVPSRAEPGKGRTAAAPPAHVGKHMQAGAGPSTEGPLATGCDVSTMTSQLGPNSPAGVSSWGARCPPGCRVGAALCPPCPLLLCPPCTRVYGHTQIHTDEAVPDAPALLQGAVPWLQTAVPSSPAFVSPPPGHWRCSGCCGCQRPHWEQRGSVCPICLAWHSTAQQGVAHSSSVLGSQGDAHMCMGCTHRGRAGVPCTPWCLCELQSHQGDVVKCVHEMYVSKELCAHKQHPCTRDAAHTWP